LGEEKQAARIARAIDWQRRREKIKTTKQLALLVAAVKSGQFFRKDKTVGGSQKNWLSLKQSDLKIGKKHPATKVFQALRLVVNQELSNLQDFLEATETILSPGGRAAIISFHSLEDRMVKQFWRNRSVKIEEMAEGKVKKKADQVREIREIREDRQQDLHRGKNGRIEKSIKKPSDYDSLPKTGWQLLTKKPIRPKHDEIN